MKRNTAVGLLGLFVVVAHGAAYADGMSNCKNAYVKDTKVVVGGAYSDADGTSRDAQRDCSVKFSMDRKAFVSKYGAVTKSEPAKPAGPASKPEPPKPAAPTKPAPIPAKPEIVKPATPAAPAPNPTNNNKGADDRDSNGAGKGRGGGGGGGTGGSSGSGRGRGPANTRSGGTFG